MRTINEFETQHATLEHASASSPASDLYEVLQMYNTVTQRLQVSHERLQDEVVRLREQLEQKNRELELKKRLAALGEMAAGIAHEIRNPLGAIQLYASTLVKDVADRPAAAELARKISSGVRSLNGLVCDMLAFTQQVQCQKTRERLVDLVKVAVELARPVLEQGNIEVTLEPEIQDLEVLVDARLFKRVILNLLLNAAEAMIESPTGRPPRLWIRAGSLLGHQEGRRTLEIADNGPGIPVVMLDRIFNPFFTTKHSGTGLGLALVHRIVEAHGGCITAENRAEGGAIFRMTL